MKNEKAPAVVAGAFSIETGEKEEISCPVFIICKFRKIVKKEFPIFLLPSHLDIVTGHN